ncbi:MAG: MMPL family transporter [Gemmatimonadales bacterium]
MDLSRWVVRRRGWVLALWIATGVALFPDARRVGERLEVAARVRGSESEAVALALAQRFESPWAAYAVLVVRGVPLPDAAEPVPLRDSLRVAVERLPGVTGVRVWRAPEDTLFVSHPAGAQFLIAGLDARSGAEDALVPRLRLATAAVAAALTARYPGATLRWTGQAVLNADLREASAADAKAAERRALPLTLLLLIVAFGTLPAALVPVLAGAGTVLLSLGFAARLGAHWPLSILLQNFVTMIGLGLGIDYGLLTVSRFREALATGADPASAAAEAGHRAGHTIALSGLAVAIGFLALLAVPLAELRSVAVGGLLATLVAVLLSVTLLPALLSWLGAGINRIPLRPFRPDGAAGERWRRWGRMVAARPLRVLLVAGLPLAVLGWQARRLEAGLPRGDWLPPAMESAKGLHDLEVAGRSGVLQSVRVLVELPAGAGALTPAGWTALRRLGARLATEPEIGTVRSFTPFDAERPMSKLLYFAIEPADRRSWVTEDRRGVLLEAVPSEGVDPHRLIDVAARFRRIDAAAVSGLPGVRLAVGGLPAFRLDYADAVAGWLPRVAGLVLVATFVVLCLGFRSVLIPLKAVLLNLLSVAGGFGVVVLVFQEGHGAALFGLAGPTKEVFGVIPTLVFCTVFGLSMDYEVFLVARVAEARREGLGEVEAIAEGLARTGPVITSAAAIMVVVFGAFTLGHFLVLQMLGLALAVAVLLDATVVRVAIGPALLSLAGRWNWWPGR